MADRLPPSIPQTPELRRSAQIIPRRSTRAVLLHLARDVRDPRWRPLSAARRLARYADHDAALLRAARARLQQTGHGEGGRAYVRAMATLCVAIADLEEACPSARRVRRPATVPPAPPRRTRTPD